MAEFFQQGWGCQGLHILRTAARRTPPTPPPAAIREDWKNPRGSSVVHAQPLYSTTACPSSPRGRAGITVHSKPSEGASQMVFHTRKLVEGRTGTPLPGEQLFMQQNCARLGRTAEPEQGGRRKESSRPFAATHAASICEWPLCARP